MATKTPFRLTRGKIAVELSILAICLMWFGKFLKWSAFRIKPIFYHPVGIIGLTLLVSSYVLSPWLTVTFFWSLVIWQRLHPYSYLRHVHHRAPSFFAGFKYRFFLRPKLKATGLINDDDPTPTISYVTKIGCVTKVRIKMSYGDKIDFWRERAPQIAQTFNAGDVAINPYRRNGFTSIRLTDLTTTPPFVHLKFEEKVTKHRWLECEFLVKDPFARSVGFEYIDFHRSLADSLTGELGLSLGSPVGPGRDGTPYLLQIGTHLLVVAMSGRGKSNAERAMIYADYPLVMEGHDQHPKDDKGKPICDGSCGLLENWIFDGKRGTEAKSMPNAFARREYGKNPEDAKRFFRDAEHAMYRRLDEMGDRGDYFFTPELGRRAVKIYIDEIMILESEPYKDVKNDIYKSIAAILQMGRAAGFTIIAFAQNPKLDRLPLRDDFPEIQIGGLQNRRQIDTAIAGGWDLGAREIPKDLPGVFYVKTEAGQTLYQIRYAHDRYNAIKKLPMCPASVWEEAGLSKAELRERVSEEILIK